MRKKSNTNEKKSNTNEKQSNTIDKKSNTIEKQSKPKIDQSNIAEQEPNQYGPLKRLSNLGNTCYYNSFLQVLNSGIYWLNIKSNNVVPKHPLTKKLFAVLKSTKVNEEHLRALQESTFSNFEQYGHNKQQDPANLWSDIVSEISQQDTDFLKYFFLENPEHSYDICSKCSERPNADKQNKKLVVLSASGDSGSFQNDVNETLDYSDNCANCSEFGVKHQIKYGQLPQVLFMQAEMKMRENMFEETFKMREKNGREIEYGLIGVSIHSGGGPNSGHYIALVKINDQWYYCNDSSVDKQQGKPRLCGSGKLFVFGAIRIKL